MKKLVFAALLIPVMGHATTFSCKAIQEGHIDSGSQPVFVMRPTNNDGQTAIYTLSLCSEV